MALPPQAETAGRVRVPAGAPGAAAAQGAPAAPGTSTAAATRATAATAERLRAVRRLWSWPIALYLFLAGVGAGGAVVGGLMRLFGAVDGPVTRSLGGVDLDVGAVVLLWGPLAAAVGAPFLILDLGRKGRFYRAGRNARASWMARGFYVLSGFIVLGGVALAAAVLSPSWRAADGPWSRGLEASVVVLALATAAYTGVLLRSLRFVPLWRSLLLPALFVASALSTGSMGIILAATAAASAVGGEGAASLREVAHALAPFEQGLILVEGALLAAYLVRVAKADAAGRHSVAVLVRGRLRVLFWAGVVGAGLVFPTVLESLYRLRPEAPGLLWAAGALLLGGGFLLRLGLLTAAEKEALPLQRLLEARAHATELRADL